MTGANTKVFSTTARIHERSERAVIIHAGLPARPVLVPLAVADIEPIGFMEAAVLGDGYYNITMDRSVAKELGLTV